MIHGKAARSPVKSVPLAGPSARNAGVPEQALQSLPLLADPQTLLDALPLAVLIVQPSGDDDWVVVATNTLFNEWAGLGYHDAIGLPLGLVDFFSQGDFLAKFRAYERAGNAVADLRLSISTPPSARHFSARFSRIADRGRIQITLQDCTTEVETEHGLRNEMLRDTLTGLPNRIALAETLDTFRENRQFILQTAILVADIDRFSRINDSLGHIAGDELLVTIARRILSTMHGNDVLARIGGDIFGAVVHLNDGPGDALHLAKRIQDSLSLPFRVNGREITIRATIGIAVANDEQIGSDELISNAEFAVTRAKRQGRRLEIYHPADATAARRRFTLETELRLAIDRNELTMVYQPIVELKTGRLRSVEALARWRHPERGPISPSEFIPLAEESGLILSLGRWALNSACTQMAEWQRTLPLAADLQVGVNVSGIQLARDDVVEATRSALEYAGLPGKALKIELTESAIIDNPERTKRILEALKGLDAEIAMDDFGTGYSSLAYLQKLPIDVLKVDHSFVSGMLVEEDSFEIINAIISLARSLSMETVAEGIEMPEQASRLKALGCTFGQGFMFGQPLTADEFPHYLATS